MRELPLGWTWAPISDVTEKVPNIRPEDYPGKEFGYVDISSISNSTYRITEVKRFKGANAPSRARRPIRPNDILFSNVRTYLRNIAIVPQDTDAEICSTGFTVLRPKSGVDPQFLFRCVLTNDFIDRVTPQQTGTHYPATSDRVVMSELIPLPPLNEQRRIAAKLEELLGKVDACQKGLAKIPVILKRFRQSVLAAACSGRLTTDWRERNAAIESGRDLLNTIKEQRLLAAQTAKEKNRILEEFDQQALTFFDIGSDFTAIPATWVRCTVGQVGTVRNGSTPSRKRAEYWNGAIPWVSSGEVRNNVIRATREHISQDGYENSSVRMLPKGSVLLAMIGEGKTRGQSAILEIEATTNQNIAAITLEHGLVNSEYLWRWFQLQYESTRQRGGGSGPSFELRTSARTDLRSGSNVGTARDRASSRGSVLIRPPD